MNRTFTAAILLFSKILLSQIASDPECRNEWTKPTSYEELSACIALLDDASDLLTTEVIGATVEGRNLFGLFFSSLKFGNDPDKIKVLIFAQQHGNEQSGKEGALLLANELIKLEYHYLFDSLDLVIIPQMNPDGSEVNQRKNGNEMDLNRNHLILTEPETIALHRLFDQYHFEVSVDVHEYFPYSEEWMNYGFYKNSDITIGTTTNLDVPENIRKLSREEFVLFYKNYLAQKGFSVFDYCPGDPPEIGHTRYSTFDINDGRQSLGIQGTFSFIQEGKNGKDGYSENLKRRAEGQMTGMMCLLEFTFQNKSRIKQMIYTERKKLVSGDGAQKISIQSVHTSNGSKLELPVYSVVTGNDSLLTINDFRPVVKSVTDVIKPRGYLIPKNNMDLVGWAERHNLAISSYQKSSSETIEQYFIDRIDSIDFEGDIIIDPVVVTHRVRKINTGDYFFIPTSQLKGTMIVLALEPKSMLGLATYTQFSTLVKAKDKFRVLRVVDKKTIKNKSN